MSFWVLVQILLNIVFVASFAMVWIRFKKPQKEDPRFSKGLQLLQSKISILEDLSDRTEVQVQQLTALLENKCKEIQNHIEMAEKQILKIEQNAQKSLEVAKIFQDKIPHTEIVERQNTIKYVKAAKMAHQGIGVDEICQQIDLSRGEIEFIAKVNRDQLMFCEASLPEWVNDAHATSQGQTHIEALQNHLMNPLDKKNNAEPKLEISRDISQAFIVPDHNKDALKKLGEQFKQACDSGVNLQMQSTMPQNFIDDVKSVDLTKIKKVDLLNHPQAIEANVVNAQGQNKTALIRPMEFKKIEINRNLQ